MDGFLCKSWFCCSRAVARVPETLGSCVLWTLDRREEGAVEGRSSPRRRTEVPLRSETVRPVPEDPRRGPGFSGHSPGVGATRFFREIGTTRLMPWFSELVRVRTGLGLLAGEAVFGVVLGFIPAARVFEVGVFLADRLEEAAGFAFSMVDADSVFSLVIGEESALFLPLSSVSLVELSAPSP